MDAIDRGILDELAINARIPFQDLGRLVGLSANAAAERVRRLQRDGVITGFTVTVDEAVRGAESLTVFIDLRLRADTDPDEFLVTIAAFPEIVEGFHVTGAFDYLIRVRVASIGELDALLRTLKRTGGVSETQTRIALDRSIDRARVTRAP